jgi:vacuolar-type H+-ATPase subunit F/Vma7
MWTDRYPIADCPTRLSEVNHGPYQKFGTAKPDFLSLRGKRKTYSLHKIKIEFGLTKTEVRNAYQFVTGKWYTSVVSIDQDLFEDIRRFVKDNREKLLPRRMVGITKQEKTPAKK